MASRRNTRIERGLCRAKDRVLCSPDARLLEVSSTQASHHPHTRTTGRPVASAGAITMLRIRNAGTPNGIAKREETMV
jgi:hypothetical protein